MGDGLPFRGEPGAKGKPLGTEGDHKWVVWKAKQFDTRAGKLVTVYRCERCKAQQVKAL